MPLEPTPRRARPPPLRLRLAGQQRPGFRPPTPFPFPDVHHHPTFRNRPTYTSERVRRSHAPAYVSYARRPRRSVRHVMVEINGHDRRRKSRDLSPLHGKLRDEMRVDRNKDAVRDRLTRDIMIAKQNARIARRPKYERPASASGRTRKHVHFAGEDTNGKLADDDLVFSMSNITIHEDHVPHRKHVI